MLPYTSNSGLVSSRVLLLNSTYEVVGTISVARAIKMTMRDDNPISIKEEVPGRFLTTAGGEKINVPSVVILKNYLNLRRRRQESGTRRVKIFLRDRYQCQYCSIKLGKRHPELGRLMQVEDLTLDHIVPKSKGGKNTPTNLVTCCMPCNQRKADRTPEEARMPLRTEIHESTEIGLDKILICKYVEYRKEWLPYLEMHEEFQPILMEMGFLAPAY